jgi:hypothetical protein
VGAIGADEIAANVIAVKHLVVADFSNIVTNHLWKSGDYTHWELVNARASIVAKAISGVPSNAPNAYVAKIGYGSYLSESGYISAMTDDYHPCTAAESFFISAMWASDATAGKGTLYIGINWKDRDGSDLGNSYITGLSGNSQPWAKASRIVAAPSGSASMRMLLVHDAGSAGYYYVSNPVIRRAGDGELIVDGAITAAKITAGSITADKLDVVNMVASDGNYLVSVGWYLNNLSIHSPTPTSGYFTADGRIHIYKWVTSAWVEQGSIGSAAVSGGNSIGKFGSSANDINGVTAETDNEKAIYGIADGGTGIYGQSASGKGVCGISGSNEGVYGDGGTYGGYFLGSKGPVKLGASGSASAPSHTAELGTLWVTSAGVLYINTDGGTTWGKVGAQ